MSARIAERAAAMLSADLAECQKAFRVGHRTLLAMQERAEQAEAETIRLRGEIEDYLLWAPCKAGHAAAHRRLAAALASGEEQA